jgi:hypothetical protein
MDSSFCEWNQYDPELRSHRKRLWEDLHNLLRRRVGSHVKISRLSLQEKVTHAPARKIGLVSVLTERPDDVGGVLMGGGHQQLAVQLGRDRLN